MPKAIRLVIGSKFGRLTVVRELPGVGRKIDCLCDCGNSVDVFFKSLRTGNTKSCGCYRSDFVAAKNKTHGKSTMIEYGHWKAMRARCNNPKAYKYPSYGGCGVLVCSRWDDFDVFLSDVGPIPSSEYSLDRFPDRHGNYEPGNVRWATSFEQMRNRDCMDLVTYKGSKILLIELAEHHKVPVATVRRRLRRGWCLEKALTKIPRLGSNQYD